MQEFAVIDFETTGLSPAQGARITEVAVVMIRGGKISERYQSLVNAGIFIPSHPSSTVSPPKTPIFTPTPQYLCGFAV